MRLLNLYLKKIRRLMLCLLKDLEVSLRPLTKYEGVGKTFNPPMGSSLATVDIAKGVQYDDRCIVVEGVVSPRGQSGSLGRGDGYDVHYFAFAGWRLPGKPLVGRELTLLRPVPASREGQQREENIFAQFLPYSIQRLSVLLSKDQRRAVVERVLTIDRPDEALLSFSERLREPVVISTEQFGDLVMNPTIGWFVGKREWDGRMIAVRFEEGEDDDIGGAIKTAETLWSDQAGWKRKVDDYAVEKLLRFKNEDWLREDEAELTPQEFTARMKLRSITVGGNGRFEFSHDDGDLFSGHSIEMSGTLKDGLTDAEVPC